MNAPSVSVTGMGWVTPLGDELEGVWQRLLDGHDGFTPLNHTGRLRNNLAASVRAVSVDLPADERLHALAVAAARAALASAGIEPDSSFKLLIGTSLGDYLENPDSRRSLSSWADRAADSIGVMRPAIAISTACSSASDAILLGAELIRSGEARCCLCGGSDIITMSKRLAHSALGTMSPTRLRAFDQRHDGTLLGEGAGFIVLEADAPKDRQKAVLRGAGSSNDATGMTAADTSGRTALDAIERSLKSAGVSADEIGLINAHGSGTPMNDETERNAFNRTFSGSAKPLVFATKGAFGHSLGATGAIEAIALIMALRTGQVPGIVGLERPDPELTLPVARERLRTSARFGLSTTLGFGGFNTSLIFKAV